MGTIKSFAIIGGVWNFGIGIEATQAGNRLDYKSRIGILIGKKR
jgi:hypothetical protein